MMTKWYSNYDTEFNELDQKLNYMFFVFVWAGFFSPLRKITEWWLKHRISFEVVHTIHSEDMVFTKL